METPINHDKEEDFKNSKTLQNDEKKVVKTIICVDYDSELSNEDYYDMSDSISIEDFFEECKDELWKIE